MQLESVRGLSASSEAATGGQVGAAVIKVQHPLPGACLVSAVNPLPEPESHCNPDLLLGTLSFTASDLPVAGL